MAPGQEPGDVALLASDVRGKDAACHYLPARSQTRRRRGTPGPAVATAAPRRTTAEVIGRHRAAGGRAAEMEAAALSALGQARSLPVASAVVTGAVRGHPDRAFATRRRRRGPPRPVRGNGRPPAWAMRTSHSEGH